MVVEIKFERENRSGIIPVGTYLFDAARRLGIRLDAELFGESEDAVVQILQGKDLLSDLTKFETEHLSEANRKKGERLARQAKFEKSGEVVIMTKEKVKEEKPSEEAKKEEYRKEFEELPLEKKIASLVELEAIALRDTLSYVMNSPYKIGEKIIDVLAEFGLKIEKEEKNGATPKEHKETAKAEAEAEAKTEAETKAEAEEKPNKTRKPREKKESEETKSE